MTMQKLISEFRGGGISGKSFQSNAAEDIWTGEFDLVFGCSSWDHRSLEVTKCSGIRGRAGALLVFEDKDPYGWRNTQDPLLRAYFESHCDSYEEVIGRSSDIQGLWRALRTILFNRVRVEGRPLSLFFDLSTCPRYLLLATLHVAMKDGLCKRISFGYAEAMYPEKGSSQKGQEIRSRDGDWQPIAVPGYEGQYEPSHRRFYLISLGFDGDKTLRVVVRKEPDRVMALLADPGSDAKYGARALAANSALIEQFALAGESIIRAPAGDCIQTWHILSSVELERPGKENAFYVCSGTKPHTLALGLHAICTGHAAVLYNLPIKHVPLDVVPNGIYWRYDLTNVTVP